VFPVSAFLTEKETKDEKIPTKFKKRRDAGNRVADTERYYRTDLSKYFFEVNNN
jgi:hypothetical protein